MKQTLILLLGMILIGACNETLEPIDDRIGSEYFPLKVGDTKTYVVEEVQFFSSGPDTSRYFLQERLVDSILLGTNQVNYRLARYIAQDTVQAAWELDSIWTIRADDAKVVVVENSVPIIKMTFPFSDVKEWDGNALNGKRAQQFEMVRLRKDTIIAGQPVDELAQLTLIREDSTRVGKDVKLEFYAKGIGLVAKDYETYVLCTQEGSCVDGRVYDKGRIISQLIVKYGNE